jgi:probable blue pigment (indigoidine) exporter
MTRSFDLILTAAAPAIWGSTYLVTTEFLPDGYPVTVAMLRALPAGLLLLLVVRQLPSVDWLGRVFLLGALNFTVFWALLFVAAYRLPGGVAATVGAMQPLLVIFLAHAVLDTPVRLLSVVAALAGLAGVSLLVLTPAASLDVIGILAGLGGAASMAAGTVLTRKWQPDVPLLTFTAWQLTAGGLLLVPLAFLLEPPLPVPSTANLLGYLYLGIPGAALTYLIWFRGVARIDAPVVSLLGLMSPLTAILLGWIALGQQLTLWQIAGVVIIIASLLTGQRAMRPAAAR